MSTPQPGGYPVTLSEVARIAGVSLSTASKAMNGRGDVSASTRKRVLEAADQLGFTPNQLARSLLAGRTGTVGLLTSDLEGRFVIPILMGAEDAFGAVACPSRCRRRAARPCSAPAPWCDDPASDVRSKHA